MLKIPKYTFAIVLILQLVLYAFLRNSTEFITTIYIPFFGVFSRNYIHFFSKIPFSVGDCFYVFLIIFMLYKVFALVKYLRKKEYKNAQKNANHLLLVINILVFCFYIFWGFLYGNKRVREEFSTENITETELKNLSKYYLTICQIEREKQFFAWENISQDSLVTALQKTQDSLPKELPFRKSFVAQNTKNSLFSSFLSYFGIGGYFNPFTYETQINATIPLHKTPFVTAHEMAHQLGYATEDEANFVGFLCTSKSSEKHISYSGNYMALKYILREIQKTDTIFVNRILESYSPKMKYDRAIEQQFYTKHEGKVSDIFSEMNNVFLRMNKQEGLQSYNQFTKLLVGYNRKYNQKVLKY